MTNQEFLKRVAAIKAEKFESDSHDAIRGGINRCLFEEGQLNQLIFLALRANSSTAKRKQLIWEKRLKRKVEARHRFERILEDRVPRPSFVYSPYVERPSAGA